MRLILDIILFPVVVLFKLVALIFKLTGKIIGIVLALVMIAVGAALTITLVGAPFGIPLIIFGIMMLFGGIFG